jgi:hypothetical protein
MKMRLMPSTFLIDLGPDAHLTLNGRNIPLVKQKKLQGFSPQANYTDRATAACRRS